jgi:hypothetical protein
MKKYVIVVVLAAVIALVLIIVKMNQDTNSKINVITPEVVK